MEETGGKIISSVIISIALVVCAYILKDGYLSKGYPQTQTSSPEINVDLSKLENIMNVTNKDVLSITEAAQYLGIKEDDFASMVYGHKLDSLPYVSIGGRIVFSKKALNDWFENAAKTHYSIKP